MEGGRKKQVIFEQLVALLEFLRKHEDLAKGHTRGRQRRGKVDSLKAWDLCAKKLNSIPKGAVKDGKGWSKYWCDWKYRAKRRALELRDSECGDRPLPEDLVPLTELEENILTLIGKHAIDDVVITNDPLSAEVEGLDEAIQNDTDNNEENQYFEPEVVEPPTESRRRRHPRDDGAGPSCARDDGAGPSCPPERNPAPAVHPYISENVHNVQMRSYKRRRAHRSPINSDLELDRPNSPLERKPKVVVTETASGANTDTQDNASAFLSIEREKVLNTGKIINTLEMIHSEIARLTTVMADIKDYVMTTHRQINEP